MVLRHLSYARRCTTTAADISDILGCGALWFAETARADAPTVRMMPPQGDTALLIKPMSRRKDKTTRAGRKSLVGEHIAVVFVTK
jgi:hypothetical protein